MRERTPLLICGLVWAAFCLALELRGHAPTRAPLPHWYALQAALLVPWLLAMGELYLWLVRRFAGPVDRAALVSSLGWPLLLGFVLPDIAVYALFGFDALWPAMAAYGAATALVSVAWGLRTVTRRRWVVPLAWLAQAAFGSLLLR